MGLSSNTLIHLTQEKEALIGILKTGFQVSYCFEKINTKEGYINGAFPMVSFSDIPLSELSYHLESYGNYGIGLKKKWAKEKGLNPVLYFDEESTLGGHIRLDFKSYYDRIKKGELDSKVHETAMEIFSYSKNYEGVLKTKKIERDNYRFSDEREWRFVPTKGQLKGAANYVSLSKYKTKEQKEEANLKLKKCKLLFNPDDINYIFVESEEEISEFIKIIRDNLGNNSFESIERLTSRIITTHQIITDI